MWRFLRRLFCVEETPPADTPVPHIYDEQQPRRRGNEPELDDYTVNASDAVGAPVGIDVSRWQGKIDWQKVRAAGYRFAFIKATESSFHVDPNFKTNREAARKAGFYCGFYHFFRPQVMVEVQIMNFVKTVAPLQPGELPPVLDVEVPEDWRDIPLPQRVEYVLQWLKGVEMKLGVRPYLYGSPSFFRDVLGNDPRLKEYRLWIAHYKGGSQPDVPAPWSMWTFWQHSEVGRVPGITGNVDLNRFNGTEKDLEWHVIKEKGPARPKPGQWFPFY